MTIHRNMKVTRVADAAGAAQTAVNGAILDMQGFQGVTFIALLGDVSNGSVLTLKAQQNDVSDGAGMADLAGPATFTAGADDADDKALMLEVVRPRERYVRPVLTRTTANAVVDGIIAIQWGAKDMPTAHDASVIAAALANDPNIAA